MAKSKNVIGSISIVAMLLSIPVIGSGIWLAEESKTSCVKVLHWPVIILGILFFFVALAGVIGGFRRIQLLIVSYYFGMFIVIILLASLVVFIRVVTARGSGYTIPGQSHEEYPRPAFSPFLRDITRTYTQTSKWKSINNCLISTSMCAEFNLNYHTPRDFYGRVTQFQSGCCLPPIQCNSIYNGNKSAPMYYEGLDKDCKQWNDRPKQPCYSCRSCKAGLLYNITIEWRKANLILIITLVVLILVYLMGCFALKKAKLEDLFGQRYT